MSIDHLTAEAGLLEATAVVIPSYFPDNAEFDLAFSLLEATVAGCCRQLADPTLVCVSVDGSNPASRAAGIIEERHGVTRTALPENKGKLAAIQEGMRRLLPNKQVRYLAVLDQDADHFPNDLPNLIRMAHHIESTTATDRVHVIGSRASRHRPMGFFRGELEELADRVLLDALFYHSVKKGAPLSLEFAVEDEFPDFHSGYKAFSRPVAEHLAEASFEGQAEEAPDIYRHAVEAVLTVESMLAGATLATVNRRTVNEQPVSVFQLMRRAKLTADMIIWPCRRLEIPGAFVSQWIDNHLARLQLMTLAEGKSEALAVRTLVRAAFNMPDDGRAPGPPFV